MHGGDLQVHNHRLLPLSEADGFQVPAILAVKHKECRRTHNQGSPSDRHETRLSDIPRQRACCEPQVADLQSKVLSATRLLEIQEHCQYPISVFFRFIVSNDSAKKKETSANRWQRSEKNDRFQKKGFFSLPTRSRRTRAIGAAQPTGFSLRAARSAMPA